MSEMKVTGTIFSIGEPIENDAATWKKVEFIVEVPNSYNPDRPDPYKFEIGNKPEAENDNVANLIKFNKVGDLVDVDFNISPYRFTYRNGDKAGQVGYGMSLRAWRVFRAKVEEIEVADVPTEEEEVVAPF